MNLPSSVNFVFLPLLPLNQHLSSSFHVCLATLFFLHFLCVYSTLFVSLVLFCLLLSVFLKNPLFFFSAVSFICLSLLRSWLIDFIFILSAVVPSVINHQCCLLSSRHWSLYRWSQPITTKRHYLLSLFLFCCLSLLYCVPCGLYIYIFLSADSALRWNNNTVHLSIKVVN